MKIKSILTKTVAVAALSIAGIAAVNNTKTEDAQAATIQNDATVVTVSANPVHVWNNYENPVATGQVLGSNTSWKVIETAYNSKGEKWYDLGNNQWVRANDLTGAKAAAVKTAPAKTTTVKSNNTNTNYNTQANTNTSYNRSNKSSYTSNASGSDASAKAWIANKESGGSYGANNGQYVGKYQLSASYLHGDYSAANQEKAADSYVNSRYGSWSAAKSFWQANGWY
ncbi:hypothetical protein [Lactobacillus acetotolerans]|uniref:aggregation-promoting factor n=1 Tax=Lactobacillus acetotolerans TaxID=1600 RepID=UPI0012E87ED5|nr:hypothetical protein [Lactobacillus acetotolerans]QGV05173.1 hypothetical protein GJR85_07145 [Lactobacillus acetotolerans]